MHRLIGRADRNAAIRLSACGDGFGRAGNRPPFRNCIRQDGECHGGIGGNTGDGQGKQIITAAFGCGNPVDVAARSELA